MDISTNPSMLRYLTGESNVAGAPNENYARELMELFTLGPVNDAGQPNYSENDVHQLAKALTGWQINDTDPNNASSYFTTSRWYNGPKLALRQVRELAHTRRRRARPLAAEPPDVPGAEALGRVHPHVARCADADRPRRRPTRRTACSSSRCCAKILTHPDLFASIDEPNMLKTPVVYAVGVMRALGRRDHRLDGRRLPRRDGSDAVLPAERLGLGGRPLVAEHEHGARPLGLRRRSSHVEDRRSPTWSARRRRPPMTAPTLAVGSPWLARGDARPDPRRSDAHALQDAHPAHSSASRCSAP